jgi:hypothetical protein
MQETARRNDHGVCAVQVRQRSHGSGVMEGAQGRGGRSFSRQFCRVCPQGAALKQGGVQIQQLLVGDQGEAVIAGQCFAGSLGYPGVSCGCHGSLFLP